MAYSSNSLVSSADTLKFRAFASIIGWALFGYLAGYVFHAFTLIPIKLQVLMSLGKLKENPAGEMLQLEAQKICGLVVGIAVGAFRAQGYFVEANKLLCMVEQEKHLRFIASKVSVWTPQPSTDMQKTPQDYSLRP